MSDTPTDASEDFRLERAIEVAAIAHAGQLDKAGEPYILHALRVMLGVPADEPARIAAVLHDVVEDTGWSLDDLRTEFGATVANAVDALTRRNGETYTTYVNRLATNSLARIVKIADLKDNLILSRIPQPTDHDLRRWEKYRKTLARLSANGVHHG